LVVRSPSFENGKVIPQKFTCDGEDVNPPLEIEGIPEQTKSLVIIMDDPDAPMGTFDHWVVWDIPPSMKRIKENTVPGVEGLNDFGKHSYGGPCPPSGTHRYFFKVYALDTTLALAARSRKRDVEKTIREHIIAQGQLMGLYTRRK